MRGASISGWVQSIVAGSACAAHTDLRVIPFRWRPSRGGVATGAVHAANDDMCAVFAARSGAVMAGRTIGGGSEGGVIDLGAAPRAGGFVARLAVACYSAMNSRCRSACLPIRTRQMAGGALRRHGNIGMKSARRPSSETALVTGIAIGGRAVTHALIRDMGA